MFLLHFMAWFLDSDDIEPTAMDVAVQQSEGNFNFGAQSEFEGAW